MAFLYVTEHPDIVHSRGDGAQALSGEVLAEYRIDNTGATTQGQLLNVNTRYVQLHTDSICGWAAGVNPVATANRRMAANETKTIQIDGREGTKRIAAILNT